MCWQAVFVVVGLFSLTLLCPGPNMVTVVHTSVMQGYKAGVITGVGMATGDGIYAACGLTGISPLLSQNMSWLNIIKALGGTYLCWYGARLLLKASRHARDGTDAASNVPMSEPTVRSRAAGAGKFGLFRHGLATDLANPQSILFFASVFSTVLTPDTSWPTKIAVWGCIVATSLLCRSGISYAFSRHPVRRGYQRIRPVFEPAVGLALGAFGLRLVCQSL